MSNVPRKRASLCCTTCNRRKVSCDKRIPCGRCVHGGLQDSCARAEDAGREEQRGYDPAQTRPGTAYEGPSRSPVCSTNIRELHDTIEQDEVVHAASVLEFLAWGQRKETSFTTHLSPCVDENALPSEDPSAQNAAANSVMSWREDRDMLQLLLPEEDKVELLVSYHLECLLWYHGSFHGQSFRAQLAEFYTLHQGNISSQGVDLQWVALLFSVLVGSISCGNKVAILEWGFEETEQELLSQKWLEAVVACLNAAAYMANLSIRSCEAIATLTISAHILGYSNQQSVLLASAVRIAQSLGLHRLHSTSRKSVERETGRRVWAQLCSQDWFSIPFSECYLINPLYCQSEDPINCDDELQDVPDHIPTVTSYCRYLYSIAALMPALQDAVIRSNTLYTKYNQVMTYDTKLRRLASEQRPNFLCNVPVNPSWPRWVGWARRAAAISSAHKIIMVHRKFLSMSFTGNPAFAFTRRTCIAASKTILKEALRPISDDGPVLWIFHAFSVAAGVTLCLDVLHREGSDSLCGEHIHLVKEAIGQLRSAHNSKIASRGTKILSELVDLETKTRPGRNRNKRKIRAEEPNCLESSQSVNIQGLVRDLQYRTSPEAARYSRGDNSHDSSSFAHDRNASEEEQPCIEADVLPNFQLAEETLTNFHASYFSSNVDIFGDLLNLAQTYSY